VKVKAGSLIKDEPLEDWQQSGGPITRAGTIKKDRSFKKKLLLKHWKYFKF
jgi:hypothetical protein